VRRASARRYAAESDVGCKAPPDIYTPEEMDDDLFYRDLLRPRGLGWATATAIPLPTGDNFAIVLEREYVRGPVERARVHKLDELRPHLARSALMSARLQLERARIASETLAALGLPALVLNEQGKVLAANSLIEALSGYVQWRAQDRVSLKDRAADRLLCDAIAAIDSAGGSVRYSRPATRARKR
jgi:PAS domain-containing protein